MQEERDDAVKSRDQLITVGDVPLFDRDKIEDMKSTITHLEEMNKGLVVDAKIALEDRDRAESRFNNLMDGRAEKTCSLIDHSDRVALLEGVIIEMAIESAQVKTLLRAETEK